MADMGQGEIGDHCNIGGAAASKMMMTRRAIIDGGGTHAGTENTPPQ